MDSGSSCPVCAHAERREIGAALLLGQSPRQAERRYHGLTRVHLRRHLEKCLAGAVPEEQERTTARSAG